MSQHGCPERLSNRSKGFAEEGGSQPTMEVLVETLTGTAFEMTVSPSDTVFAIKSKIFRVEGIPVSQQHLLYNLRELEDSASLHDLSITDGARLRLVLGMRGGPISTRRLPPPSPVAEPWPDIERLLDSNRDDLEWSSSGCKVTVLVFRDGERVNMLRVKENCDGTYSPIDHNKYSTVVSPPTQDATSSSQARDASEDNVTTMNKMMELRRRMETLSLQRSGDTKVEIQKTRSEETLSVGGLLDEAAEYSGNYAPYSEPEDTFTVYHNNCTSRYPCELSVGARCAVLPAPRRRRLPPRDYGVVEGGWVGSGHSASALQLRAPRVAPPHEPPLQDALFSSSTSDLETLKRNSRMLPALSRHRPREHLHLSDETLAPPAPPAKRENITRVRCLLCRKRLSIATVHVCRCGGAYCAPHRYAEVHACAYDYKAPPHRPTKLPRI